MTTPTTKNPELFGWGFLIVCILSLIYWIFGGEVEGTMNNISNCQVELTTTDEVYNRIFKSFICEYDKTKDGKIIDGTCYHATFDSNNNCKELISYEKKPEISCPTGQHVNYYGSCECSESEYLKNGICYNKCGTNAHYDYYEKGCYCNDGYFNSESLGTCVKSLY